MHDRSGPPTRHIGHEERHEWTKGSLVELPEHLLLFDGVCNLCNGLVQFMIRHDKNKRFRFAPLQSGSGKRILARIGEIEPDYTSVYIRKGRVLTRSSAALYIARDLGGLWALAYPFMLVPRFIRDAVYDLVARNRFKWFGRREKCMVPTQEFDDRFIH